ncbi:scyllo-inositol 2-dehydrogenase (NADP(+)) [Alicyclobacillus cellulosilyticus]|uniref:Scyllo-inositol 2-dehydrogenase (NADP(+)) n=1 Tax=Alicyclobacillus cellulosilyticus TaxID=1003997 RepID=A0A917KAT8_9BACL|nr:Gfo/Idh/MocA family oxidoreductase [Alicyclobacillus cellulosilyticus]GGJ04931.1 scyllo-inositol 2-dehydrogenase (NADP(+)) [Alicyclobacillus cellulosilyticus]
MNQVRFLIIGAGGMGRAHIRNLVQVPEAVIVGLVDPSAAAIEAVRQQFPQLKEVPSFASLADALARVQADAAVIVTPHSQHFEQGMMCLDAGLHVLMEKPFVAGSENARTIIERARQLGRHLAVAYQRHVQGPYLYLRHLIQSGALGDIQFITAYQAQAWQKGTAGTWRQDPALSCGGQLNDSGSHLLDVVLWMTGAAPKSVMARIDHRGAPVDIDSALTVTLDNGAIATFNIVGSASIEWWEDVSVHGTKGTALYRNGRLFVAREGERHPQPVPETEFPPSSDPDRNFVDLILGRVSAPAAPAECGLAVARLTEAAWESAETGQVVWLP